MTGPEDVGNTPLVDVDGVMVKLECSNPGGSIKDRIARFLLEAAEARRALRPGDTVVEATSGNTGIALALAGRQLGYRVMLLMPEHMSPERRRMMENLGAEVCLTPRAESFAGAIARRDRFRGRPGFFVPDQFGNPDNPRCHYETTGAELVQQLRAVGVLRLEWFVAGVGTGGTLMGVARALREGMRGVSIAAVEPEESAVLSGGPPGEHGILGIGDGFVPALVDLEVVDRVLTVRSDEALSEAARLRREHGYCVGVSAGANHLAARRLRGEAEHVATVWPDCSDRYGSTGLAPPDGSDARCRLAPRCAVRSHRMLHGDARA